MKSKKSPPIHPGTILLEEFSQPMKLSQYRLTKNTSFPPQRINKIVHGKRAITADTALRLGKSLNLTPLFWMNIQSHYDLEPAEIYLANRLDREVLVYHDTQAD